MGGGGGGWGRETRPGTEKRYYSTFPQRSNAARVRNISRFNGGKLLGNLKHFLKKSKDKEKLRSVCAPTLAFSGSSHADIMSRVGWQSSATASDYVSQRISCVQDPSLCAFIIDITTSCLIFLSVW